MYVTELCSRYIAAVRRITGEATCLRLRLAPSPSPAHTVPAHTVQLPSGQSYARLRARVLTYSALHNSVNTPIFLAPALELPVLVGPVRQSPARPTRQLSFSLHLAPCLRCHPHCLRQYACVVRSAERADHRHVRIYTRPTRQGDNMRA